MKPEHITTRRAFLHRGLTLVGTAATVPVFLERSAHALAPDTTSRTALRDGRILVVVQLAGGNDGLNTVVPVRNDDYYRARPQIGIARRDGLALDDEVALHPSLTAFKSLFDDGRLAIVQGVGYPNPDRSHFKSTDIWQTASPDGRLRTGWIGRYFDNTCRGSDKPDPQAGVALTSEAPLGMIGRKFSPVAFQRPDSLTWQSGPQGRPGGRSRARMPGPNRAAFEQLNEPGRSSSRIAQLDYLQRTALDARMSAADIQRAAAGRSAVDYPGNPLAQSLRTVARMITANMPTKIYYVSHGGYDTHQGQAGRHAQLLEQLGGAIKAFVDDLSATGHLDRVTLMTFSEFGRRVEQNASGGTDHGTAAPMFLVGAHLKAGLHGQMPSLNKLDGGDLVFTTDFRTVYAAVLQSWLGADARGILQHPGPPLPLFRKI